MSGENNPHYGKPRSPETKHKISMAQSGEKSSKAKLTKKDVVEIIQLLKKWI
ncbi:MAG: NUMOD3 domain-containing DNA-binding protein [Nitrosotalea sp.]